MAWAMATTAFPVPATRGALGMSGPSNPLAPWISGHRRGGRVRGFAAPLKTPTSSRPIRCKTRSQGLTLVPISAQLEDLRERISHVGAQLKHLRATSTG
jgi:hypothetical protein